MDPFTVHHSPLTNHQQYMQRCLELAKRGAGHVAPNPMVGALLLFEGRIIGEGWHQQYGGPHAEVHAIGQALQNGLKDQVPRSTLYVSLEPCAHFGKTPPCTELIIKHQIPRVVIGCRDPFKEVDGKGIDTLRAAGVEVEAGVLEQECKELNKRFFTFHIHQRPYVILKWAQTGDGYIAPLNTPEGKVPGPGVARLFISNEYTNRLVHQWRSEEAAILVGTRTALYDDPELTTRLWPGPSPVRLVVDMELKLPATLKLFDRQGRTIVFNTIRHGEEGNLLFYKVAKDVNLVRQLLGALYRLQLQSVIVEGGARLLQSFIDEGAWDEFRKIENRELKIGNGIPAPVLPAALKVTEQELFHDKIEIFRHRTNNDS